MPKIFINRTLQRKLTNQGMTVIAANCMGAFILHDLHQPFNSPLWISISRHRIFALFTKYGFLPYSTSHIRTNRKSYPVGKLADLEIHFMHYHSEQEANENGNFARHEWS